MTLAMSDIWIHVSNAETPHERVQMTYDNAVVGKPLGPVTYVVDAAALMRYDSVLEMPTSFVTVPLRHTALLRDSHFLIDGGGINGKSEMELFRPPKVGDVITVSGGVIHKYIRRGKPYVVLYAEARNQRRELVDRFRMTEMRERTQVATKWEFLQPQQVGVPDADDGPRAAGDVPNFVWEGISSPVAAEDFSIGQRIAQLSIDYNLHLIRTWEETIPHYRNIHDDFEVAASAGFGQPFASGTMLVSFTVEKLFPGWFGEAWTHGGALSLTFARPVIPGERVTFTAEVAGKLPRGKQTQVVFRLDARLTSGPRVAGGFASAIFP